MLYIIVSIIVFILTCIILCAWYKKVNARAFAFALYLAIMAFFVSLAIGNAMVHVEKEYYTETIELSEDTVTFVPTDGKAKVDLHKKRPIKDEKREFWLWLLPEETEPDSYTIYIPKEKMGGYTND